ncbi:MAG: hypothetical protein IJO32_06215 [Bacilli bacterium]|nr:hypothetical protein [Bacilli bacterium]
MKLTSKDALKFLCEAEKTTTDLGWIKHSRCVGETAGIIAERLGLDVDKATALGYDDEYCNICLTHSYLNNDVVCTAGGIPIDIPFRTEFIKNHEYTIYEKIINLCDLMCTKKRMILEQRLIEIMIRRGCHENTVYHITEAQKLKKEFDDILGCSVYSLFDDIEI